MTEDICQEEDCNEIIEEGRKAKYCLDPECIKRKANKQGAMYRAMAKAKKEAAKNAMYRV